MALLLPQDGFTLQKIIGTSLLIGGVVVSLWGVWPDLKGRRKRRAPTAPVAETRLSPLEDNPGWWRLDVLARNLDTTPVEVGSLALSRSSKARLAPYRAKSAAGELCSGSFPPVVDSTKLVKLLPFQISLAPAGSEPTIIGNFGFISPGSSSADTGQCLLFLPASSSRRKVIVRMHSFCKTSAERRMSSKLKIIVPASAALPIPPTPAVAIDADQTMIADLQPSREAQIERLAPDNRP